MRVKERDRDGEETGERPVFFRTAYVSTRYLVNRREALSGGVGRSACDELVEGLCDDRARRISVATRIAPNAHVAVLVHELAHALVGRQAGLPKQLEELVVEAVAYIVCAGAGLDTGADSVPYIAGWGGNDALEQLQQAAELIDALARRIEPAIGPARTQSMSSRWGRPPSSSRGGAALWCGPSFARERAVGAAAQPHHIEEAQMPQRSKPTRPQLRYLRQLAEQTGTSFTPPRTSAEARHEIDRLKQRARSAPFERQGDRRAVSRGLSEHQPASSVRDDEIQGYGGNCRWKPAAESRDEGRGRTCRRTRAGGLKASGRGVESYVA